MNLSDREIIARSRIELGSLAGSGKISGTGSSILATGGDFNATVGGNYSSIAFSSGTTTLSGSYSAPNTTILSGAIVNAAQVFESNGSGIISAAKLAGNLTIQPNGVLQSAIYDRIEHGVIISGNLVNNGTVK